MGWFLYEIGPKHLAFDANEPLTQELARSVPIHRKRLKFYLEGDLPLKEEEYGLFEQMESVFFDSFKSIGNRSLPISWFLGSFWYQVKDLGDGKIGFRIDNKTDIASGTHFSFRTESKGFSGSMEDYLNDPLNQHKRNWPLFMVLRQGRFISILNARGRGTPLGSGEMYQTFSWIETRVCPEEMVVSEIFFSKLMNIETLDEDDYPNKFETPLYLKRQYGPIH